MREKDKYIQSKLTYTEDNRLLEGGLAIMMDWETPIMEKSAEIVCQGGGDILNIGFGLGIVDTHIQEHSINSHTILECHPDVLDKINKDGWVGRDVKVLGGFWQDHFDSLPMYDGVYFDTWKEQDFMLFFENVHKIVKPGGTLSFFVTGDVGREKHSMPKQYLEALEKNFHVSSEIIDLEYEGELDGIDKYWDRSRKQAAIPVCIKK